MQSVKIPVRDIAKTFLHVGAIGFGGPAAHISLMETELVHRKGWIAKDEFLDLIGAANLIPGPNSSEVAMHIGYKVGGWPGLFAAGFCFILPAFISVWFAAWLYVEYGSIPMLRSVFMGIKPVIVAMIAQAVWRLGRTAVKDRVLAVLGVIALSLVMYGIEELMILLAIAVLNLIARSRPGGTQLSLLSVVVLPADVLAYFARVGSLTFGSGYVLVAFLQSDLVERYHWISSQQLLDAVAVGQFTPGPVFTTATFIGYLISGNLGAILATVGIFLPAFVFVALTAPVISKLRDLKWAGSILDGLNVASLSLMVGVVVSLTKDSLFSTYGLLAFTVSLVALLYFRVSSAWIILGAGLLGALGISG